jgi:hypothetical protein
MFWCLAWDVRWWCVHTCALTLVPVRTLHTSKQNHCKHLAHVKAPPLIFPRKTERASLWVTIGQTAAAATTAAAAAAEAAAAAATAVSSPQLFPIPLGTSPQPQILLDSPNCRCRGKNARIREQTNDHMSRASHATRHGKGFVCAGQPDVSCHIMTHASHASHRVT